ncbi:MAG: TIGR01212 family radical SAM protein [Bacteroidales bacterium]|nr:TIGR01212 family radical SAM protein [Bacteroidales bacterium]
MSIYSWGDSRRYNSYSSYLKSRFGGRVQKLSLHAGFTCPNRDGTIGYGGCDYCDNSAFNPSYCNPAKSIAQQLEEGIAFHQARYRKAVSYLAYFQAYSNSYGDLERLKQVYGEALSVDNVAGLVIGTRPDCMDEAKLEYLARLSEKYYVMLEYGVESCSDRTLSAINRGHDFAASIRALELTRQYGLPAGIHLIFGLPDETPEQWMGWVPLLSSLPITTIKFHQLQIIRNTRISALYQCEPQRFHLFRFDEYVDFMVDFLERFSPHVVIERFAGEVPPRFLQVQAWDLIRNEQVVQVVERRLAERDTFQGLLYSLS